MSQFTDAVDSTAHQGGGFTQEPNIPTPQHACPNCGYCPHCGRGRFYTHPFQYPYWTNPGWIGNRPYEVTFGGSTQGLAK